MNDCDACRWWMAEKDGYGKCRRNAPLPMHGYTMGGEEDTQDSEELGLTAYWPVTAADDFCGEWTAKNAPGV